MKQEQEELAFDRKILEQLIAQSKAEQQQQAQRKVSNSYCLRLLVFSYFCLFVFSCIFHFFILWS